jgi:hypothetical protein
LLGLGNKKEWVYRGQPILEYPIKSTLEHAFEDLDVKADDRIITERRQAVTKDVAAARNSTHTSKVV